MRLVHFSTTTERESKMGTTTAMQRHSDDRFDNFECDDCGELGHTSCVEEPDVYPLMDFDY